MTTHTIAVPSALPGGLEAALDQHFGRCAAFTLVDTDGKAVRSVRILSSIPHAQGSCLEMVGLLADAGVTAVLAGGLGKRPLQGLLQRGVAVYDAGQFPTVSMAVDAFLADRLCPLTPDKACQEHH